MTTSRPLYLSTSRPPSPSHPRNTRIKNRAQSTAHLLRCRYFSAALASRHDAAPQLRVSQGEAAPLNLSTFLSVDRKRVSQDEAAPIFALSRTAHSERRAGAAGRSLKNIRSCHGQDRIWSMESAQRHRIAWRPDIAATLMIRVPPSRRPASSRFHALFPAKHSPATGQGRKKTQK